MIMIYGALIEALFWLLSFAHGARFVHFARSSKCWLLPLMALIKHMNDMNWLDCYYLFIKFFFSFRFCRKKHLAVICTIK